MENQTQGLQPTNSNQWLKTLGIGFGIVSFGIAIGVIGYILGTKNNQTAVQNQQSANIPTLSQPPTTPTSIPDETTNWKIYNGKYFSFKYPSNWTVEDSGGSEGTAQENYITFSQDGNINGHLTIDRKDYKYNPDSKGARDITLDEWMSWNRFLRDDLSNQNCTKTVHGLLSGYECSLNPYGSSSFNFISKTDKRFIDFSGNKSLINKFTDMISTFKFTQ